MAFYSQGKEFLNLPEQVQKNATDIADLKTKEATNATDIASNTADLADLKNRTETLETNTTAPEGTIKTGTLDVEKDANFGSNVEVDGVLTINSPSDLHFKEGDIGLDEFNSFKTNFYGNIGRYRFYGSKIYVEPEKGGTLHIKDDLASQYTNIEGYLSFASYQPEYSTDKAVQLPDFDNATTASNFMRGFVLPDKSGEDTIRFGNWKAGGSYILYGIKGLKTIDVAEGKVCRPSLAIGGFANECSDLETIGEIDMSGVSYFGSFCIGAPKLKHIHMKHFRVSFEIKGSTAFETADLVEIISNLDPVTTPQTLTMGATNLAKLTQDQILVATGKGWTLA